MARDVVQIVGFTVYCVCLAALMNFSLRRMRFAPTLVPTLAALVAALLTSYLGYWQQGRAAEKYAMQAEFDARAGKSPVEMAADSRDAALRYRQAVAKGEWLASAQIYVDNKVSREIAGFHVITPLKLNGTSSYLLVNRGWIPRGRTYPAPPQAIPASGLVTVSGQLTVPSTRFLELSPQSVTGQVWQNFDIARYREATHLDVLPFVLLATDTVPPLERVDERPDARAEKHVEYMLTWYSLSVTVVALWIGLNTKQLRPNMAMQKKAPTRRDSES